MQRLFSLTLAALLGAAGSAAQAQIKVPLSNPSRPVTLLWEALPRCSQGSVSGRPLATTHVGATASCRDLDEVLGLQAI